MIDSIQKLTRAMAAGDEQAVETFYREYFNWLYGQARRATGRDEAFCLDVVQDAILRIVRTIRSVDSEPRLRGWLRLVVQTTALDHIRRERSRLRHETAVFAVSARSVADEVSHEGVDQHRQQWLIEQISRLDPELVQIIELRFSQRWTLRRIAEALGISIATIDGRLRRAIRQLKVRAGEEFDE